MVKNLPAKARDAGDAGLIQGWEDHLEEKMTPVILPRKEEPGGLWSIASPRVDATEWLSMHRHSVICLLSMKLGKAINPTLLTEDGKII